MLWLGEDIRCDRDIGPFYLHFFVSTGHLIIDAGTSQTAVRNLALAETWVFTALIELDWIVQ